MSTDPAATSLLLSLVPLIVMTIPLAIICYLVAKEKGRNPLLYGALGIIPFVNGVILFYLVATPDRVLHEKVDRLLAILSERPPNGKN